jgi:hypothetical protein
MGLFKSASASSLSVVPERVSFEHDSSVFTGVFLKTLLKQSPPNPFAHEIKSEVGSNQFKILVPSNW